MSELNLEGFELQDIKFNVITESQVEEMKRMTGSYDALFSKRSMQYKALGLKDKTLSEIDLKNLILQEYTFLKRPVFLLKNEIFVGNSKKVIEELKSKI